MKKVLDWSVLYKGGFDDRRRKAHGMTTGRELFAKAYEAMAATKESQDRTKAMEPILKAKLVEMMVNRIPIKVLNSFSNPTESLGGIQKSENTEEDNFYYNGAQSGDPSTRTASASFEEVMETVPQGIELLFKSHDKQLGQFVFQGSNGHEYAIYSKPQVMFQNQWIQNPGYYGILFNTQIKQEI